MFTEIHSRDTAHAEVLLWQSHLRITVAIVAGGAEFALQRAGVLRGSGLALGAGVVAYVAAILLLRMVVKLRAPIVPVWAVAATILADLAFIFVSTVASSSPGYYDRVLVFAFFSLHLAESYFGRGYALLALGAVAVAYTSLVAHAIGAGAPLLWPEELWSLGVFVIAAAVFVMQYGGFRDRLSNIVALFERAEEGDFTREYDVAADARPDAITLVGRAYNRVRSQLASMVLTDPLTECLNRRGFDQAVAREISRAARASSEIALLAIDVDHFKLVNDTHGHPAGDAVLREVGALLMQGARGGDVVARTGGEEFAILLPDTSGKGAFNLAVRICDTLRDHIFIVNEHPIRLTLSIGMVATGVPRGSGHGAQFGEQLKLRSDQALYHAKRTGRDRVWAWTQDLSPHHAGSAIKVMA